MKDEINEIPWHNCLVFMEVPSLELFNKDLRTPLEDLGYQLAISNDFESMPYLMTRVRFNFTSFVSNTLITKKQVEILGYIPVSNFGEDYYIITFYNPEFFLELAALTNLSKITKQEIIEKYTIQGIPQNQNPKDIKKMKLDHKLLAPYLPFGINCYANFDGMILDKKMDIFMMENLINNDTSYKLALRPLSDLSKEMSFNGEVINPKEWIQKNYIGENMGLNPATWSYRCVNKLLEWGFDVFNLIPEGLAIDIKTKNSSKK